MLRNKKIGFIFQNFYLDEHLMVYENVILPMLINENIPKQLSDDEQQRTALVRALVNDQNIILVDEPTGNLDKKNEDIILGELKRLSLDGKLVIAVGRSDEIKKYADVVLELKEGKLFA